MSKRKVEFQPMMRNEGISPKKNEPEGKKRLRVRGRRMGRDDGVEKIRGGSSGRGTTTVGEG